MPLIYRVPFLERSLTLSLVLTNPIFFRSLEFMTEKNMSTNAHDVQICLWKLVKLLSRTCVQLSTEHPFVASSLLGLLLLYLFFPLVFWALIHSVPLVVCIYVFAGLSLSFQNGEKHQAEEEEEEEDGRKYSRKKSRFAEDELKDRRPYGRVHSVRRRRPRNIRMQNNGCSEKNNVSCNESNADMVDESALVEESPKEIREVQAYNSPGKASRPVSSPAASSSPSQNRKRDHSGASLGGLNDEKQDNGKSKAIHLMSDEDDDEDEDLNPKDVTDVAISDAERTKRLESLIARRRSRKLLSIEMRRTLMNKERNEQASAQIASLVIPKHNSSLLANEAGFSPGSAPSVLIPVRNPFDLPYDPQEEKPDLTGDTFNQEFLPGNSRDFTYCRHESFSLGAFLPGEYNHCREEQVRRQRNTSQDYQFFKPENEHDKGFDPVMDQESYQVSESMTTSYNPADDHIKEVIQVHKKDGLNHSNLEEETTLGQVRKVPEEDFTTGSSSPSSTEEDEPIFKIDKEAILKSLSSMAHRNAVEERESNMQQGDYNMNSGAPFDHTRLKEQFFSAERPPRHHVPSYSIASDLQVEVSEMSSPPLTIDDNFSYQDDQDLLSNYDADMEKKITWEGEDSWAGTSHPPQVEEDEPRSGVDEISEADVIRVGFSRINTSHDTILPDSMGEQLNENDCSNDESPGSSRRSSNLDDKIVRTLEKSLSSMSSRRIDPDKTSNISQASEKLDESYEMEYLSEEGTNSSKDSDVLTNVLDNNADNESIPHGSEASPSSAQVTQSSNDPQEPSLTVDAVVEQSSSSVSPDSVLQPSIALDQDSRSSLDMDEDVQQFGSQIAQVPTQVSFQNFATPLDNSIHANTAEVEEDRSVITEEETHKNGIKPEEPAEQLRPAEETISSRSFNGNNEASSGNSGAADQENLINSDKNHSNLSTSTGKSIDMQQSKNSSLEKDTKHEETASSRSCDSNDEASAENSVAAYQAQPKYINENHSNSSPSTAEEMAIQQSGNSSLEKDTKHEDYLNEPNDEESKVESLPSSSVDAPKEVTNLDSKEFPVAASESTKMIENDQQFNADESTHAGAYHKFQNSV